MYPYDMMGGGYPWGMPQQNYGWGAPQWGSMQGFGYGGGMPSFGGYAPMMQQLGGYQPQAPNAQQNFQASRADLRGRIGDLREQYKGAGTEQQAGIMDQIGNLQGRIRRQRRQAQGEMAAPQQQAAPGQAPAGATAAPMAGSGAFYNPGAAAGQPVMRTAIPGFFDTQFGRLTTASGGNSNVFKREGGDENTLYSYDPTKGWGSMSLQQYRSNPNAQYADPSQYGGAGAVMQDYQRIGASGLNYKSKPRGGY